MPFRLPPKCTRCGEEATYLAYMRYRIGSVEYQEWSLACAVHKQDVPAYKLVLMKEKKAK